MRTHQLWRLREETREHHLAPARLKRCGRVNYSPVQLLHADGSAWFEGVVRCRCRTCPVCWVVRRVKAALEITWVTDQWQQSTGLAPYLCTMTVRHHAGDPVQLTREVRECWRRLLQRRAWRKLLRAHGTEWVAAEEVTHGENGWHPHIHLLLLNQDPFEDYLVVACDWYDQWCDIVTERLGAAHAPEPHYGLDIRPCNTEQYLTKLGIELSDPTAIKGRSPLQLLEQGQLDRYMQLQDARKRARDITYSRGLKPLRESIPPQTLEPEQALTLSTLQWHLLARDKEDGLGPLRVLNAGKTKDQGFQVDAAKTELRRILGPLADT